MRKTLSITIFLGVIAVCAGFISYQFRYERLSDHTVFDRWHQKTCYVTPLGLLCSQDEVTAYLHPSSRIYTDEEVFTPRAQDESSSWLSVVLIICAGAVAILAAVGLCLRLSGVIWYAMPIVNSALHYMAIGMPGVLQLFSTIWLFSLIARLFRKKKL
jgi:hypothetical protein